MLATGFWSLIGAAWDELSRVEAGSPNVIPAEAGIQKIL
jgi:hypothetical protein